MATSQGMQLQLHPIIMMPVLVQVVVVILSLSATTIAAPPTEADLKNHGCMNRCGNLNISYPFGVEKNCYLSNDFFINCSDSRPYLRNSNITISNISLEEGELRIMNYISHQCYDRFGTQQRNNYPLLRTGKFSISKTKNKFTAIGCDTYGGIVIQAENDSLVVSTGCVSECVTMHYASNGTCSGNGCCQTSIPKGVGKIIIIANSFNNHTNVWGFNPCSYAFVVEEGAFNFSTTYLQDFKEEMLPMVLDWGIGNNETCEEAKRNSTSYACGQNSDCYDAENVAGYSCICSKGYQGNAYLSDGCIDIDECADLNLNQCVEESKCLNTPGNYTCSCPKSYQGDGKTDGTRCTAGRVLVLQIVIGIAIGALTVLVSSSWLYWIFNKRRHMKLKEKFFKENGGLMLKQQLSRLERPTREAVKIFTLEELKRATNNYDDNRIVGRGGFGTVYKGILVDNTTVAIKKSQIMNQSQIEQFINEVVVLSQINHRNVVKLLGCCLETQVPLLVYEFIINGTLFEHIHNHIKASNMSWENRLRIAAETAGVLSYLHSATSIPIIHRDVKSTNILLDDNYTAKVSDFGASRLVPLDQDQLATVVQGTLGYLDPEYMLTNQLTEKSDVYSFGVVLVELITGKKVLSFDKPEKERSLARYFLSCMKNDRLFQVIDEQIEIEGIVEELTEVANIAKRCLIVKGEERPTMKEVAMELEGLINKKMKKHPWVKIDLNGEESEHLLGGKLSGFELDCTTSSGNTTTTGYDSVREHMASPMDGGR
ncbi:putative wall-associated receptor kinase-like 16 [Camellia sinensis]|uniref:putative wall-associated receptor kinase-like 16 n=1 Tax=Camellia sinensis TaxID=4442 RepID=UPI00103647BE|nr:putative wall-associated receptor kinase-like 16 [Camellia sinensis]